MKHLDKIVFGLNLVALVPLVLAYLAGYIHPEISTLFSFAGLAYPLILMVHLFFVLYWVLRQHKRFALSFLLVLVGWWHVNNTFAFRFWQKHEPPNPKSVKLLSYNVRLFNRWLWKDDTTTTAKIFEFLKQQDADIISLQEYYSNKANINSLQKMQKIYPGIESFVHFQGRKKHNSHHGLALFSKYPIVKRSIFSLGANSPACIYADIALKNDTIRVYNIHLASLHLESDDYKAIDDDAKLDKDSRLSGLESISVKLHQAFIRRAKQLEVLMENIDKSPHPVIVTGDFNATPVSYTHARFSKRFQDSFSSARWGMGITYSHPFSFFRIDYIFADKPLKLKNHRVHHVNLSDHYPLEVLLEMD